MKLVTISLLSAGIMMAGTVTFDALATPQPWGAALNAWDVIPASYDGFHWVGWEVMNQDAYSALYGDATAIPSNPNFAYSGIDSPTLSIGSTVPFLFLGTQLAGWPASVDPVASSVTITGYLDGNLVGSTTQDLSSTEWRTSGGIAGLVDTLEFVPTDRYFRMDDFEASPTPEPATMALVGIFLIGLGVVRGRKVT